MYDQIRATLAEMDAMKVSLSMMESDTEDQDVIENIQAAWDHLADARESLSAIL